MKTKAIALLAVLGLCVQVAHAAEPYTLEQLKALALESNPSLGAARADVDVSRADTLTARAYPNPELEVMGGDRNSRGPNLAPGSLGTIGLSQRFDYPSQRDARLRVAEAGVVSAQSGVQSFEIDLLAQLKQNYYLVIRYQDELRAAQEDLELARSIRNRVEVRVNTGEAPRYELIRADTELLTAQKNADAAVLRIVQAKTRLRALVRRSVAGRVRTAGRPRARFRAAATGSAARRHAGAQPGNLPSEGRNRSLHRTARTGKAAPHA